MNIQKFFNFFLLLTFGTILMTSCNTKGTTISGNISDAGDMSIYLDKVGLNNTNEVLLNDKIDTNGDFKLSLPNGVDAAIYRIRVGAKGLELVTKGDEKKIEIKGDLNSLQAGTYSVTGAPLTEEYLKIGNQLTNRQLEIDGLTKITETADPLLAFMVASRIFSFREDFADIHTNVSKRLTDAYPNIYFANEYQSMATNLSQALARKMATALIKVGMDAPEIELPNPQGKMMRLSDYRGKVVLIDFWASWCRPCRQANPHVVEVYEKYKSKGFEVFSVSLDGLDMRSRNSLAGDKTQLKMNEDRQKERWVAAIQQDKLSWDGHVSDLMKWDSKAAATYGVSGIPKTFLVDKNGKIAVIDPRYNLEEAVAKHI